MATRKKSTAVKDSRYVQGGDTTVYSNRLGWWERTLIDQADDDIVLTIPRKYALRPDLLAYDLYGKASLQWLVLQFNNIVDINTEFVQGKEIRVPSPGRVVLELLGKTTGGLSP